MKVVMLGMWPINDINGGVSVHTVNLINSLSKFEGIDLNFISFSNKSKTIKKNNSKIILIKSRRIYYILPIIHLLKLRNEIKKINPDILQVQGTFYIPYLIYSIFAPNKFKKIVNVYGLNFMELEFKNSIFDQIHLYMKSIIEKYTLTKFQHIIVESSFIKEIIQKMTNSQVYIIPDGIEYEKIKPIKANKKKSDIFLVTRLIELKGIDLLIKAVSILKKKYDNIKILIAGTGPSLNELKKLTQDLKLEKNITFLGFISDKEKYQYYKSSKIVVVPSRWDCSPIAIYEGLGCGKPVIASSNTNSDILEDGINGLIFESDNVQDLADKIEILLDNDQLRSKMEDAALKKAINYDWQNIGQKYYSIYENVMS